MVFINLREERLHGRDFFLDRGSTQDPQVQRCNQLRIIRLAFDQRRDGVVGITDRLVHGRSRDQCHDTPQAEFARTIALARTLAGRPAERRQEAVLEFDAYVW